MFTCTEMHIPDDSLLPKQRFSYLKSLARGLLPLAKKNEDSEADASHAKHSQFSKLWWK